MNRGPKSRPSKSKPSKSKLSKSKSKLSKSEQRRSPLPVALRKLSTKELARRVSRSVRTVQRWKHEGRLPEQARAGVKAAAKRREHAQAAARRSISVNYERQVRDAALGRAAELHGKNPADRHVLETMIRKDDLRWQLFRDHMLSKGRTMREVRDRWFSPKGRRKK